MSDETDKQIKHLIKITHQDIAIKSALLSDVVEGEILVSEMLQDIKLDVADIKDGLFQFFNDEQVRFKTQQDQDDEQYFRTLEALREARGDKPEPTAPRDEIKQDSTQSGSGSRALGTLGTLGAGLGLGAVGRFLVGRFLPAAAIAGVVTGVIDYMAERPRILEKLSAEGLTGEDLETEATTQALGEVMSDFSDNVVEPLVEPIAVLAAKEFGFNDKEIIDLRKKVDGLSKVFERGTEDLVDIFSAFLGRENSRAALREDEQDIAEIGQELREAQTELQESGLDFMPGGEVETGMVRREEILKRLEEIKETPKQDNAFDQAALAGEEARLQRELRPLSQKLAPVIKEQEIQSRLAEQVERSKFSQAGYRAGNLNTQAQIEYKGLTSEEKDEFFEENVAPDLQSALDAGAIERSVGTSDVLEALPGVSFNAVPVNIKSIEGLQSLNKDQLEAILVNDDILNNSILQTGAMETSDRKIVEYIYRMKTEGAADPRLAPVRTASPESQSALQSAESTLDAANRLSETFVTSVTPSPTVSAAIPVNDMSRNMVAQASAPIVISTSQGGSQVTNMVNNNSTTVLGGGAPARSSDVSFQRLNDRMQYT